MFKNQNWAEKIIFGSNDFFLGVKVNNFGAKYFRNFGGKKFLDGLKTLTS